MHRCLVHPLALAVLLVQGVFGSISPAAVICISHAKCHPASQEAATTGAAGGACGERACCRQHPGAAADRPTVAVAPPCEDECPGCVDIGLPDHAMLMSDRDELDLAAMAAVMPPVLVGELSPPERLRRAVPSATGPPRLSACPHAAIVRSTRLLV